VGHHRGAARCKLQQEHVAAHGDPPAQRGGEGSIVARDLVRNALRMRPIRIIVGRGSRRGGHGLCSHEHPGTRDR